jgi:hypothetical protein
MLPVTKQGGQLPIEEWPNADKLVAGAWKVLAELEKRVRPKITDNTSYLNGALASFKKNIERFSEQTERLKHGPPFTSNTVVTDYLAWGADFERWAKGIDETADFGTTWGMFKDVSDGMMKSVKDAAEKVAKIPAWVWVVVPGGIAVLIVLQILSEYGFGKKE